MSTADPNRVILTGENPFIRLSENDGDPNKTDASFWRIIFCPAGMGHVLYLKSELTENRWRIYSDNIAMARWLQSTVQGMLNAETADAAIPVLDAQFTKLGDPRYFWTERVVSRDEEISLWLVPLIALNRAVDGCLGRLGRPGRWWQGTWGRACLGLMGLLLLGGALLWGILDWMQWTW